MDATIYFGKVYVIEWLGPGDAKTGWELFDELQPIGLMSKPSVEVSFRRVRTRDEFIAYIRTIQDDFRATKRLPLLHIETHGFIDGICSAAGDEVLWPELMQELIPLNRLTQLSGCFPWCPRSARGDEIVPGSPISSDGERSRWPPPPISD